MRIVRVGGRALRVSVREGTPGWPPLLLCNGIGVSLELLQPFVDALDPRRPVIRFDMPGIGGSPAPVIPYHLSTLPSLLAGLLDRLGYAQADVLGISWGGGLAQQFALSRPDRCAAWCWWRPRRARSWSPGIRASCCACLRRDATATPPTRPASPASCTAAVHVKTRSWPGTCCTPPPAWARPGATSTS